jgi:hypothetical protein
MYEVQGIPTEKKWKTRILSGLVGVLLGAGIASGVFLLVMREQERRHQMELVAVTTGAATPAALIGQAGNLIGSKLSEGTQNETSPTSEEIATYLNGKTLPLPEGDSLRLNDGEKSGKSCIMTKEGVDTVQKGNGYRFNNDPWTTPIIFLYNHEDARYAVEADISHQSVGNKTAFFGLTIKRVAKQ